MEIFQLTQKKAERGLPLWLSGKEPTCPCRRDGFDAWSGKTPHAMELLSPCATTEAVLWSRGAATTEPKHPRACALQPGKALRWEAHAPQLEKDLCSEDLAQPKINNKIITFFKKA